MPDWAIVLVAAFGGGLAGAVLQPVTTYVMDRLRSGDRIQKSRQRTLRQMLVAHMGWGRQLGNLIGAFWSSEAKRTPLPYERWLDSVRHAEESLPLWEPERITDEELKHMVTQYHACREQLLNDISSWSAAEDLNQRRDRRLLMLYKLHFLQTQITRRMDKLNYPEVDD